MKKYVRSKELKRAENQRHYQKHKAEYVIRNHKYYTENKTSVYKKQKEYFLKNKEMRHNINSESRLKLKIEVITHYGNGKCACVKCGFDDIRALTIDHINNGGTRHREETETTIYRWLKRNGYPEGYQSLCMNCNLIKEVERRRNKSGI